MGGGGSQSVGVRWGPQGGVERAVGRGERAAAEHCALQQAGTQWPHYHTGWQGLERDRDEKGREKHNKQNKGKMAVIPAGPSRTQTRRAFPDTKAEDFKVCNVTVIFTLIKIVRTSALGSFPLARIVI